MRGPWKYTLALSLGMLATTARAGEPVEAPVALGRPIATTARSAEPAATIARPMPLPGPAASVVDPNVQPTTYSDVASRGLIIRGASPDAGPVRPMPVGPAASIDPDSGLALHGWRRGAPEGLGMPTAGPEVPPAPNGSVVATSPGHGGPILEGNVMQVPHDGGLFGGHHFGNGCEPQCDAACCLNEGCGCGCGCICLGNRWYVSAEYLLWWVKGDPTPPLVTAGSAADLINGRTVVGALDQANTVVEYGGTGIGGGTRSGIRLTAGYWFTDDHALGLEGSYFTLGTKSNRFADGSPGTRFISRPIFETNLGRPAAEVVSAPGPADRAASGFITVDHRSNFWGAELNLKSNVVCGPNVCVDLLAGFRSLTLDESLTIHESVFRVAGPTSFDIIDRFSAKNRFYGGQLGATGEYHYGNLILGSSLKVGLGTTQEIVNITGGTVINGTMAFPGNGILAQPTNGGTHTRDVFSVVPEVGLTVGYQFTERLRGSVGYNFLYWTNVARPGTSIDTTVNANQAAPPLAGTPIPARPFFDFKGTDFWAQGVNFNLEYRF